MAKLLFLLVAVGQASGVARNTAGSAKNARWWPMDLGLGSSGDMAAAEAEKSAAAAAADAFSVDVPGEGSVHEDEMVSLQQEPKPMPIYHPPAAQAPLRPLMSLARSKSVVAPKPPPKSQKVVEEFDVDESDDSAESEAEDDARTEKMVETKTKEEMDRERKGDVEHVKPKPKKKRLRIPTPEHKVNLASQHVAVKHAEEEEQAPGAGKQMAKCMAFANWVKSQGSTGPDFVRIWKGTCMPGVMAGAPPAYGNMCNALGTAVSKFAVGPWDPSAVCQAVIAVFAESGVGASPLG